jgi:hypothetical protein
MRSVSAHDPASAHGMLRRNARKGVTDHSTGAVDRGAQGRPEDCKIKARDACATLSRANTLSERWVRTAFAGTILARHEARHTEERKFFSAVLRGVVVQA